MVLVIVFLGQAGHHHVSLNKSRTLEGHLNMKDDSDISFNLGLFTKALFSILGLLNSKLLSVLH